VPVKKGSIRPGLDVQGEVAYVICPPSDHISGGSYVWEASRRPEDIALAPLPEWIIAAASRTRRPGEVGNGLKMDALIPSGERNTVLTSLAGTMRRRGMSAEAIVAALLTENGRKCRPPLPEEEVCSIVQSIERYSPANSASRRTGLVKTPCSKEATPADSDSREAPVSLAVLLERVLVFVRTYVFLTDEQLAAVTLWVAHTHALKAADASPYLNIYSPEKRSGKSRLLEALSLLVAQPWLTGRVTPAALVRKVDAEAPTLLLDESDAAFRGDREYSEALRGLLNSGWRRGGKATVCAKKGGDWVTRDFSTFCPKAIAGIGNLPDTIVDRAIPIEMKRKTVGENAARFRWREVCEVVGRLREDLAASCSVSLPVLTSARPEMPRELDDRAADIWEPLLAIADAAGGDWPGRARAAALTLSAGRARNDESIGIRLLSDIRDVFSDRDTDRLTTVSLLEALNTSEEALWGDFRGRPLDSRWLSRLLRPYGVKPKTVRLDGRTPKGYLKADFCDAWARYLDVPSAGAPDTGDEASATRNIPATERCDPASVVVDVSPVSGVEGCTRKHGAEAEVVSPSPMLSPGATSATLASTQTGTQLRGQRADETRSDVPATEGDALRNRLLELGRALGWPAGVGIRPGEAIVEGETGWRTFTRAGSLDLLATAISGAEAMHPPQWHASQPGSGKKPNRRENGGRGLRVPFQDERDGECVGRSQGEDEGRNDRRGTLGDRRSGKATQPHDDVRAFPEKGFSGAGKNGTQPDECAF
jgi:hypothetical protein